MGYAIALAQPCPKGFTHPTVESAQLLRHPPRQYDRCRQSDLNLV